MPWTFAPESGHCAEAGTPSFPVSRDGITPPTPPSNSKRRTVFSSPRCLSFEHGRAAISLRYFRFTVTPPRFSDTKNVGSPVPVPSQSSHSLVGVSLLSASIPVPSHRRHTSPHWQHSPVPSHFRHSGILPIPLQDWHFGGGASKDSHPGGYSTSRQSSPGGGITLATPSGTLSRAGLQQSPGRG